MKILYFCHTGVHTALVGAAIHLGLAPSDKTPGKRELFRLPHFDGLGSGEVGTPFYIGKDESGNQIYVFGVRHEKEIFTRAIKDLLDIYGISPESYLLVDLLKCNNPWISVGGWFSTALGWNRLGRAMVALGIARAYEDIVREVDRVKRSLH